MTNLIDQNSSSEDLYAACQSGDRQRQAAAYRVLWTYLYRIAYQLVRDQADGDALAQDCAQAALVRIHQRLDECRAPAAFRSWSRRIASNLTIDRLRRERRLMPLPDSEEDDDFHSSLQLADDGPLPETLTAETLDTDQLRQLLMVAPLSDRSRRVVIGRYIDDLPDEQLAGNESELTGQTVAPSHVQVTRAKNIVKLRKWDRLRTILRQEG